MNRFTKPDFKKRIFSSFTLSVVIFIAVIALFVYGISAVSNSSVVNDQEILSEAVNRDIVHCYCIEGMYPPNISYMEDHYGLIYDKDKFIVDYEYIRANIMPKVTIVRKTN